MAISLINVGAWHVVKESKLELQDRAVLDWDQIGLGNLKSVLGDITQVSESSLDTLMALLLCIFLSLSERCRSIEDSQ